MEQTKLASVSIPTRQIAPSTADIGAQNDKQLRAIVRAIRADAQSLKSVIEQIRNDKTQASRVRAAIKERSQVIADLNEDWENLKRLLTEDKDLADRVSDHAANIESAWHRIRYYWQLENQTTEQFLDFFQPAKEADALLEQIIYESALLTIPGRVQSRLQKMPIGAYLRFDKDFADELELVSETHQKNILYYLNSIQYEIGGLVDVHNKSIYRVDSNYWRRAFSFIMIAALVIAGGYIAYWLPTLARSLGIPTFPDLNERQVFIGYISIMLGGIAHVIIDGLKQLQRAKRDLAGDEADPTFLAVGNWVLWCHVREGYVIAEVVVLWVVFLGAIFYQQKVDFLNAFLMGYSSDSFLDTFLQKFDADVAKYGQAK
jgi:hypothetical protein